MAIEAEGFNTINLATPQKVIVVNEYENMIKEQLFTEETKGERFNYSEENEVWGERLRNINVSINKCLEHAEKNL